MISHNTSIVKADLPVGFAYRFNSIYFYILLHLLKHEKTSVLLFHGIKYIYRTDSTKNRGYENQNQTVKILNRSSPRNNMKIGFKN